MSTYLLAFVVSDFENELCPPTGNGVQFRIWARKNALDQGGNSLALCIFKPEKVPKISPSLGYVGTVSSRLCFKSCLLLNWLVILPL